MTLLFSYSSLYRMTIWSEALLRRSDSITCSRYTWNFCVHERGADVPHDTYVADLNDDPLVILNKLNVGRGKQIVLQPDFEPRHFAGMSSSTHTKRGGGGRPDLGDGDALERVDRHHALQELAGLGRDV
jgi:hypothetical protein